MKKALIGIGMLALACFVCGPAFAFTDVPHPPIPVSGGNPVCGVGDAFPPTSPYGAPPTYTGPKPTGAGSLPIFSLTGPSEGTTGPVFDTPITSWPADGAYDFCAAFDTAACSLGALSGFSTDIAAYAQLFVCSTDINGPIDMSLSIPVTGNGIPDGEFEMGVLAGILNNAYTLDASKVGHTNADIITAYKANFFFFKVLVAKALSAVPLSGTPTDLRSSVPGLIPWVPGALVSILAGMATQGDATTVAALDTLLGLLDQIGVVPPAGGIAGNTTGFASILGPNGDADGDGFTNKQEYNHFHSQGAPTTIQAELTFAISPPPTVASVVVIGAGSGHVAEGSTLTLSAVVINGTASSYVWSKDGVPTGGTASSLVIPSLAVTDSGKYTVTVVTAAAETIDSKAVIVTVAPAGQLPLVGGLGLALLAGACALGGVGSIRRRK